MMNKVDELKDQLKNINCLLEKMDKARGVRLEGTRVEEVAVIHN